MFGDGFRSAKARRKSRQRGVGAALGVAALLTGFMTPSAARAAGPVAVSWTSAGTDVRAVVKNLPNPDGPLGLGDGSVVVGNSVFVSSGDRIIRVDKTTGQITLVAGSASKGGCVDAPTGAEAGFAGAVNYTLDGEPTSGLHVVGYDGRLLYVTEYGCGVRSVDPVTGATRTLTGVGGTEEYHGVPKTTSVAGHTLYSSGARDGHNDIYQRDLTTGVTSVLVSVPDVVDVLVTDEKYV